MKFSGENSGGKIANVIIIPMIGVVVFAVACVFALMIWSSRVSDESAANSQRKLLNGAIELKLDQMSRQQAGSSVWDLAFFKTASSVVDSDWLKQNIGAWLNKSYGFEKTLILNRDGDEIFTYSQDQSSGWASSDVMNQLRGAVAKTRARYISSFIRTPSGLFQYSPGAKRPKGENQTETGLLKIGREIYFFSAAAITQELHSITAVRTPPAVLISFDRLDPTELSHLATISDLSGLQLSQMDDSSLLMATIELKAPNGEFLSYLKWQANRPGTDMLGRVTPVLLLLALAILALTVGVIDFTRQSTRKLAESRSQAVFSSRHDALSGLPNREQFSQLLRDALVKRPTEDLNLAVVYIDMDRFKDINDTLGHAAGDEAIRAVARRLQSVVPNNGAIARISGDEFAMLLQDCPSQEWIEHILTRIQDQLVRPVRLEGTEHYVSLSMGAAVSPRDGMDPGELLRKADIALYDAKANGRGRWSFFDSSMQEQVLAKDKLSRELRKAIDVDGLSLAYQPQTDTSGKTIVAVEALARWNHPELGPISPVTFIPLAEETGLINDLGIWVLNQACKNAHRWPDIVVSVNVSPTQFKHPRFVETILETLDHHKLPPSRLEIEVTESVFAGQDKPILNALKRLKDLGVKVALDDFGAGYSSLSFLRKFPFDTLKIDRNFLSAMDDDQGAKAILATIISLGKALGMTVVAEGVETAEQMSFLTGLGCHRMQGFYIARPMEGCLLEEFLADMSFSANMPETCGSEAQRPTLKIAKA
ncbi:bifunctional diguanylate cyclase/phosphodiesterase [Roseibium suaedae]|uniref:Periplasmic sensor diguanylate cyclase/phosphodiesterase n=1 Tax=Roseibium suaedae TaxID=735517 RepID=A0A1M7G5T9_9HYPH|nr:bifunctional diguanylate cyclase/phosphodiesterase [Roseibium suaedae]SHM11630.1 periplasmic sensor diguanylate cyclase/phosphodiesterase [Roseibium suaedae]